MCPCTWLREGRTQGKMSKLACTALHMCAPEMLSQCSMQAVTSAAHRLSHSSPLVTEEEPVWVPAATSSRTCRAGISSCRSKLRPYSRLHCTAAHTPQQAFTTRYASPMPRSQAHHGKHVGLVHVRLGGRACRQPVNVATNVMLDDHEASAQLVCGSRAKGRFTAGGGRRRAAAGHKGPAHGPAAVQAAPQRSGDTPTIGRMERQTSSSSRVCSLPSGDRTRPTSSVP